MRAEASPRRTLRVGAGGEATHAALALSDARRPGAISHSEQGHGRCWPGTFPPPDAFNRASPQPRLSTPLWLEPRHGQGRRLLVHRVLTWSPGGCLCWRPSPDALASLFLRHCILALQCRRAVCHLNLERMCCKGVLWKLEAGSWRQVAPTLAPANLGLLPATTYYAAEVLETHT